MKFEIDDNEVPFMAMRKKHLRTKSKRLRKAYNHPSPWKRKKCNDKYK